MKSCSSVPSSFSRTMALAESIVAIIWTHDDHQAGDEKIADACRD
jgi:hypothetical protein